MQGLSEEEWQQKYVYLKEITCPCCDNITNMTMARKSKARIEDRDSDFFIRYKELNLYFYEVWICKHCGYGALMSDFENIKKEQIKKVKNKITINWQPKPSKIVYDINMAIERYKLALINYIEIDALPSQIGINCLKLVWMYRLKEDDSLEKKFLNLALEQLEKAYVSDPMPFYGLDKEHVMYLLGELNRRLDKKTEALHWYSRVLSSREASQKLKERIRDQRELI